MSSPTYGRRALLIQSSAVLIAAFAGATMSRRAAAADPIRLVALGDSLTAGYGLPPEASFPVRLEQTLKDRGHAVTVENAGVSGDTSTGGLARLDWAVGEGVRGVLVELGANDALRGVPPEETLAALDAIVTRLKARGIGVLLLGMRAPPNMGEAFQSAFDAIYPTLAKKHGVPLYPFFLDGVAGNPALNQPDGLHPTQEGVTAIVDRVLPHVEAFIAELPG